MQSVLYHHGVPARAWLLGVESRKWLAELQLASDAREQITTALALVDAIQTQLVPLDTRLRDYAKRQPGCRALMRHFGIGPLTSVTILAELGDARRFDNSGQAVRFAGLDITVHQSDRPPLTRATVAPRTIRAALGAVRGRAMRAPALLARPRLLPPSSAATRRQSRLPGRRPQAAQAQLSHAQRPRRGGDRARLTARSERAALDHADAPRPVPEMLLPPAHAGRPS